MKKSFFALVLFLSAVLFVPAQTEKTATHTRWICLESTIATYSEPERHLNFVTVVPSSGCRIALPVSDGERVEINSDGLDARDGLEGVFDSIENLKEVEQNRKNNAEPFSEFPHNDFFTTLLQEFNYSPDSARAKFCSRYPRAYVPFLDWRGLTEPKPCSAKSPTL